MARARGARVQCVVLLYLYLLARQFNGNGPLMVPPSYIHIHHILSICINYACTSSQRSVESPLHRL